MTYFILYFFGIASIWWVYRVGWTEALKTILSVLIPSLLIIGSKRNSPSGPAIAEPPLLSCVGAFFNMSFKKGVSSGKSLVVITLDTETTKERDSLAIKRVISFVLCSLPGQTAICKF